MFHFLEELFPELSGVSSTVLTVSLIVAGVFAVLSAVATWRIFTKAGEAGWKSLIPVYNIYIMFKISWSSKSFWNVVLFAVISGIDEYFLATAEEGVLKTMLMIAAPLALIYAYIVLIKMNIKLSRTFGHGVWFGLGLYFFPLPFQYILGFGKSKYTKPQPGKKHEIFE